MLTEKDKNSIIEDYGQVLLSNGNEQEKIQLMTIIGEIEGQDVLPNTSKSTKYEHILPQLAAIEDDKEIEGVLLLINTVGGDVSAGLALAEMIASMDTPTVSLVLGDAHSIGVPLTVSADYSFIAPTATMIVHPVRMNGTIIGAPQTFDYFKMIQDRIVNFICKSFLKIKCFIYIKNCDALAFSSCIRTYIGYVLSCHGKKPPSFNIL